MIFRENVDVTLTSVNAMPDTNKATVPNSPAPPTLAIRRCMAGRDTDEAHRSSTPLEALFDLTTVVAVSSASARLHQGLIGAQSGRAVLAFLLSFFAIWWPWMGYTWFASAYDTDDIPYRLATLGQMIGVLLIAAGLPEAEAVNATGVLGFFLMRISLVALWLRASREHPERRATCRRYAAGIGLLQLLWIGRALWLPAAWLLPGYCMLMALEFAVPMWAEGFGETPWHPRHIAERYGLFTIILLGQCMAGAASAMNSVLEAQGWSVDLALVSLAVVGLLIGLWWTYFLVPFTQVLQHRRERAFLWGYGHAVAFIALAVLGGVLEVVADALRSSAAHAQAAAASPGTVTPLFAVSLTAAAVSVFLAALWWLGGRTTRREARSPVYVIPPMLASATAVVSVSLGLPLAWGLLLLAAGPAAMIAWVMRDRHLRPEAFAVR